jgi:hypothetical protein
MHVNVYDGIGLDRSATSSSEYSVMRNWLVYCLPQLVEQHARSWLAHDHDNGHDSRKPKIDQLFQTK